MKKRMRAKDSLTDNVELKQLKWYGHLMRIIEVRLPKCVFEWVPPESRKRGRPSVKCDLGV